MVTICFIGFQLVFSKPEKSSDVGFVNTSAFGDRKKSLFVFGQELQLGDLNTAFTQGVHCSRNGFHGFSDDLLGLVVQLCDARFLW